MRYRVYRSNELYHAGVKGMKWGVRKKIDKIGRSISVANINERIASVKRSMERLDARSDRRTSSYKIRNAKIKARLDRLKAMRRQKVRDLSPDDIEQGRSVYKAMKGVTVSVAFTAASLAAGAVSMPLSIATKVVGAGVGAAVKSADADI